MRRASLAFVLLVAATACAPSVAPLPAVPPATPVAPSAVQFPRDAGPHDALTEWWYYTGHLQSDADGHRYGFEFTIFQVRRQNVATGYLGHLAVTDVDNQQFSFQQTFLQSPEAASALPLDVNGWTLSTDGSADWLQASMARGPTANPPFGLDLRVQDHKPPALHHGGYIDEQPNGGSYYYSRTRLDVTGTLHPAGGADVAVHGLAWMDHQWGDFVVAGGGGWDWYSLQLDDQTELMLYVLRDRDGRSTGIYGSQVQPDGRVRDLAPGDVTATPTGQWQSPHTGGVYPSGWQLSLWNGEHLNLQPQVLDQELYFSSQSGGVGGPAYWEGAVTITGDRTGQGYVELTGYAG